LTGKSTVQVAVRWLLQQNFISSVIIGAKTIRQLDDNMGAGTGWKLSDDQVAYYYSVAITLVLFMGILIK